MLRYGYKLREIRDHANHLNNQLTQKKHEAKTDYLKKSAFVNTYCPTPNSSAECSSLRSRFKTLDLSYKNFKKSLNTTHTKSIQFQKSIPNKNKIWNDDPLWKNFSNSLSKIKKETKLFKKQHDTYKAKTDSFSRVVFNHQKKYKLSNKLKTKNKPSKPSKKSSKKIIVTGKDIHLINNNFKASKKIIKNISNNKENIVKSALDSKINIIIQSKK